MDLRWLAAHIVGLACSATASSAFIGFSKTLMQVSVGGVLLDQHRIFARFNDPSATLLACSNLVYAGGATVADPFAVFYHKDNSDYNGGVLSRQYGTWAPQLTGSATLNRPYDSFLTVGGDAASSNTTAADPSWNEGGSGSHAGGSQSWNRPDLLNSGGMGWFNSNPPNLQGQVGVPPNSSAEVLVAQFVVDRGAFFGAWRLTIAYTDGFPGSGVQFATSDLPFMPAPGGIALLALIGFTRSRARTHPSRT